MRWLLLSLLFFSTFSLGGCSASQNDNAHTTATTTVTPSPTQVLTVVPPPEPIDRLIITTSLQMVTALTILSPRPDELVTATSIPVHVSVSKAYPGKVVNELAPEHLHIVLDNLPYEDYYDLSKPFELHNLTPGKHVLRIFLAHPWHGSYKDDHAFQMVTFSVRGSDAGSTNATKDGSPDAAKPLLTYNSPKGEYKGADANPIMIDFFLTNAKLKAGGGEYRVRYIIDNDQPRELEKWEPIWLQGWTKGKHTVRLELLDKDWKPLDNGGFNITTREINVAN